ncbi:MAG: hypothetical protein O3C43_20870 [Verrucomicrobia bacterium]|nr:hypothetical protein [Verrucomicrobiota bacterium]MDA1068947.1 hypothetical protein [Verrucomicrobiota bacterium]
MAQVTEDFLRSLRSVRGEFENTKGGKIGNRILAHIFSTLFPVFFLGFFVFWAELGCPLSGDQWLLLVGALASFVVGILVHRTINSRYVFNEEGVEEWRGSGTLKQAIAWSDLNHVDYRESRGIKSFTLKSNKASMHLEFYKGLSEALARIENNEN